MLKIKINEALDLDVIVETCTEHDSNSIINATATINDKSNMYEHPDDNFIINLRECLRDLKYTNNQPHDVDYSCITLQDDSHKQLTISIDLYNEMLIHQHTQ